MAGMHSIFEEFRANQPENPSVLWQYTDARGCHGILTTSRIWATHYQYLNDPNEIKYFSKIAVGILTSFRGKFKKIRRAYWPKLIDNITKGADIPMQYVPFIACFSV